MGMYFVYDAPAVYGMLLSVASIDFYHMYWERGEATCHRSSHSSDTVQGGTHFLLIFKSRKVKKGHRVGGLLNRVVLGGFGG